VSLGGICVIVIIQLLALLVPIACGLKGIMSGGIAGLTSILAWALIGVPASYAVIDLRQAMRVSAKSRYAAARITPIQT
jgi:hypothetical protein